MWVEDIKEERDNDKMEEVKSGDEENFYSTSSLFPNLHSGDELTNKLELEDVVKSNTEVAPLSAISAQLIWHVGGIDSTDDIHYISAASKTESWEDTYTLIAEADTGFNVDSTSDADASSNFMVANRTVCGIHCMFESHKHSIVSLTEDTAKEVEQNINVDTFPERATSVKDQCAHEVIISAVNQSIAQSGNRSQIEQDAPLSTASDETEYGDTYDSDYCTSDVTVAIADDVLVNSFQNEDLSSEINEVIFADTNETSSSMLGNVDDCEYRSTAVSMHFLSTDSSISTNSVMLDVLADDVIALSEFEAIDVSIQEICDYLHRSESLEDVDHTCMRPDTDINTALKEATDYTLSEERCVHNISLKDTTVGESIMDAAYHFETEEREFGNFEIDDPLVADDAIQFLSRESSKTADLVACEASDGIASITICANQDPVCYPMNDNLPENYIDNSFKINTFAKRLDYLISVDKLNSPKKIQDDYQPINEGSVSVFVIEEEIVPLTETIQETESILPEKNETIDVTDGVYHPQSLSTQDNGLIALCSDSSKIQHQGVAPTLGRNKASVKDLSTISSTDNPDKLRIELLGNLQDAEKSQRNNISFFKRLFGKKDTQIDEKKFIPVCCAGVLSAGRCYSTFSEETLDGGLKRTSTVSGNSMLSTEDSEEGFLAI